MVWKDQASTKTAVQGRTAAYYSCRRVKPTTRLISKPKRKPLRRLPPRWRTAHRRRKPSHSLTANSTTITGVVNFKTLKTWSHRWWGALSARPRSKLERSSSRSNNKIIATSKASKWLSKLLSSHLSLTRPKTQKKRTLKVARFSSQTQSFSIKAK